VCCISSLINWHSIIIFDVWIHTLSVMTNKFSFQIDALNRHYNITVKWKPKFHLHVEKKWEKPNLLNIFYSFLQVAENEKLYNNFLMTLDLLSCKNHLVLLKDCSGKKLSNFDWDIRNSFHFYFMYFIKREWILMCQGFLV
jgi:hypothetical protein